MPPLELNTFLRIIKVASTGGQAKLLIRSGKVKVNGEIETQLRKKLSPEDVVEFQNKRYVVGEIIEIEA